MVTQTVPSEIQTIVNALDDRRAQNIVVLDLSTVSATLDYFIVASGESNLQIKAMETSVRDALKEEDVVFKGVEGPSERWVLLDYGDIVIHLMSPDARDFYDLEGLWADAEQVDVTPV